MKKKPLVSIILPCRNEEQALPLCLKQVQKIIQTEKLNAEVIVSDSSTDQSPFIAEKYKVIVIKHTLEGYGNAYHEAFKVAQGKYIIMIDADDTYDFSSIPECIQALEEGNDLVIGNRFPKMQPGAMPLLNKYVGNPLLSMTLNLFFKTNIKDTQSGMRAITMDSLKKLNLQTTGMEFASEMIIKALKNNLKINTKKLEKIISK